MNNMMIDLGVKLTKDFTLKQTNFKDKAKNYLI